MFYFSRSNMPRRHHYRETLNSGASIVRNGTEDVDNCSILITVIEIIRCAIQHALLELAFAVAG